MHEHGATRDEVTGTWDMVHRPDREGGYWKAFKPWSDSDPEEIAEQIDEYRQRAAYAEQQRAYAQMPQYQCTVCHRPFQRGVVATLCRDCG